MEIMKVISYMLGTHSLVIGDSAANSTAVMNIEVKINKCGLRI